MFTHAAMIRRMFPLATIAAVAGWAVTAVAGDDQDPDRVRRAITYLDARQHDWFQFANAQRGKGESKTACVSCHTGVSYALARPALGRFGMKPDPAEPAARMVAMVGLRVEHWAELDSPRFRLMYDTNSRKKAESRGTEAVISALVLARDDDAHGRAAPGAATLAAFQHLWETQAQAAEGDNAGSWDWLNFGYEPWEADDSRPFGAALAAIAVGSAPGYLDPGHGPGRDEGEGAAPARGVRLLRDYLRRQFAEESSFNRLWTLEAATFLAGLLSAEQQREVIDQLIALQRDDGGWALAALGPFDRVDGTPQAQDSDGYATGLVLHALLRARVSPTRPELARGLDWLRSHQQTDGSWPGRSVNKQRDPATFIGKLMTDSATAIAALALVEAEKR